MAQTGLLTVGILLGHSGNLALHYLLMILQQSHYLTKAHILMKVSIYIQTPQNKFAKYIHRNRGEIRLFSRNGMIEILLYLKYFQRFFPMILQLEKYIPNRLLQLVSFRPLGLSLEKIFLFTTYR